MPLNMVQKWMGHARISTTAIYADVSGYHRVTIHEFAYVAGRERGRALIMELDSLLLGVGRQSRLRRSWRDVDDPAVAWAVLLPEALRTLRIAVRRGREASRDREAPPAANAAVSRATVTGPAPLPPFHLSPA